MKTGCPCVSWIQYAYLEASMVVGYILDNYLFSLRDVWVEFSFWTKADRTEWQDIFQLMRHCSTDHLELKACHRLNPQNFSKEETFVGSEAWDGRSESKIGWESLCYWWFSGYLSLDETLEGLIVSGKLSASFKMLSFKGYVLRTNIKYSAKQKKMLLW